MMPPPSLKNLVKTMRLPDEQGVIHNTSHSINFARLAAGQRWTTEQALRAEFLRQEQADSFKAVDQPGVDE